MHPEFLHALAQERRTELLRQRQFRHRWKEDSASLADGRTRPGRGVRISVGTALVAAGTRLLNSTPARVDVVSSRR
jgi:hypothetical protein